MLEYYIYGFIFFLGYCGFPLLDMIIDKDYDSLYWLLFSIMIYIMLAIIWPITIIMIILNITVWREG